MTLDRRTFAASALLALLPLAARAAPWPEKPIRVMVPFPAGGTTDILGRMVAEQLQSRLQQTAIVDNQPGATGTLGTATVARAPADGYTLLLASVGTVVTNQFTYKKLPYDPKALIPVVKLAEIPNVVMVRPTLAVQSVADLVELMKKDPGKLTHGSPGLGSSSHISAEIFKQQARVSAVHVPYKGAAPMLADLVGGSIDFTIDQISGGLKLIEAGRLRALAVTSRERTALLPQVPTMIESGFKDYEMTPWFCVEAPAGTPRAVVEKINETLNAMLKDEAVIARLQGLGAQASGGTPEDLARLIAREEQLIAALAKTIDLRSGE